MNSLANSILDHSWFFILVQFAQLRANGKAASVMTKAIYTCYGEG